MSMFSFNRESVAISFGSNAPITSQKVNFEKLSLFYSCVYLNIQYHSRAELNEVFKSDNASSIIAAGSKRTVLFTVVGGLKSSIHFFIHRHLHVLVMFVGMEISN